MKESGRGKDQFKIRDLFADTRCSLPVLEFLSTTDVGRRVPPPAEDDAQSEASEWELRELRERDEEQRQEAEEQPLFLLTPPSWPLREKSRSLRAVFFCLSFVISFVVSLVPSIILGTGLGGGQGELQRATLARTADRNGQRVLRHDPHRSHAINDKKKKEGAIRSWISSRLMRTNGSPRGSTS
jgi:hypothetical protein